MVRGAAGQGGRVDLVGTGDSSRLPWLGRLVVAGIGRSPGRGGVSGWGPTREREGWAWAGRGSRRAGRACVCTVGLISPESHGIS